MSEESVTVTSRHDIGLMTAARLIAVAWAGLLPLIIPCWLIIKAEIAQANEAQDHALQHAYVSRGEFEERMRLLDERSQANTETLREIRQEQRALRELLERKTR